jgi:flagellar protein FliT
MSIQAFNSDRLISQYQAIEQVTAEMADAARRSDWKEVNRLEQSAVGAISGLRAAVNEVTLDREQRIHKLAIMRRILANDAVVRELTNPWLKRLSRWVPGNRQTTSLNHS